MDTLAEWIKPVIDFKLSEISFGGDHHIVTPRQEISQVFEKEKDDHQITKTTKIQVTDKRGNVLQIYTNESHSINSDELSASYESDVFYPTDEIYKVQAAGKLVVPLFKKKKSEKNTR